MNNCGQCNKETKNKKFCSLSCTALFNNKHVDKYKTWRVNSICEHCNSEIKYRKKRFCSQKCYGNYRAKQLVIVVNKTGIFPPKSTSSTIKKCLYTIRGRICEICKLSEWQGQKIPLVLDHINGRCHDNNLSNLRLVCGNCDMQLPTYKSKNKNSDRKHRRVIH